MLAPSRNIPRIWFASLVVLTSGACTPNLDRLRSERNTVGGTAALGGGSGSGGTSNPTGSAGGTVDSGGGVSSSAGGSSAGASAGGTTSVGAAGGQSSGGGSGGTSATNGGATGTGGSTGPCFTQADIPAPTVLHYNFDETTGTSAADDSGNSNSGLLQQGAAWTTNGRISGALNLTGAGQYVQMPDNIVNGVDAITVAAWVKLAANPNGNFLFDIGSNSSNHFYLKNTNTGINVGAQVNGGAVDELATTYTLPLGVWKHLAVKIAGGQYTLFIDGTTVAAKTTSFVPSALGDTSSNRIGIGIGGTVNLYGAIDDFRIYNRDLTPQEVERIAPPGSDYIRFDFDESCGSQAHDTSDNHLVGDLPAGGGWASGRIGGSLALDRTYSEYLSLPQGVISTCSDLTVALWVLRTSPQNWERIFVFGQGMQTSMTLAAANSNGFLQFASKLNGSTLRGFDEQILAAGSAAQTPQSGLWSHVAVVLQAGTGRLYFNGTQANTNTIAAHPSDLGTTIVNALGQPLYLQEPSFAGRLDDLRISCRAFTPNEIKILALVGQ